MRGVVISVTLLVAVILAIVIYRQFGEQPVPPSVDAHVHAKIRETLQLMDRIFALSGITYWIDAGTVLGAVRHQDIIPWDDDGDVFILDAQRDKFVSTIPIWKRLGYGVTQFYGGYKVFHLSGAPVSGMPFRFPFVDVFVSHDEGDRYNYADATSRKKWPDGYWRKEEVRPLRRYTLGGVTVWGPGQPEDYLVRNYGANWRTHGRIGMDHATRKWRTGGEFRLPNT